MKGSRLMANANTRGKRFEARLSDKKESAMINDWNILLKTFKREKISPKGFAKVILEDPAVGTITTFSNLPKGIFLPNSRLPTP
jgi:hypothetical protein